MKIRPVLSRSIASLVATGAFALAPSAQAQLNWGSGGLGGTGTWINDGVTANWFNGADVPWAAGNLAIFGGTAGNVTASGTIAGVNGITFNTTGYAINGGTLNLTGNTVTAGPGISATISSILAGTSGLSLTGGGTLRLTAAAVNTLTGTYTVGAGSTLIAVGDAFSATGNDVVVNGTLDLSSTSGIASGRFINNLTGSGVITTASAAAPGLNSIRVKAGDFSGSIQDGAGGRVTQLLFQATAGLLNLSGNNTYTGDTLIREGGTLRLSSATALPTNSLLRFAGATGTLELANGDLVRTMGGAAGTNGIVLEGGTNYFAALGADRAVTLNGGVTWGGTGFATGVVLGFGSANATHTVNFTQPLSFGNVGRTIDVQNGPAAIEGNLVGAVNGGGTAGVLTKTGLGTLQLSSANTIAGFRLKAGTVIIANGASNAGSVFNSVGVASGDNATLTLQGNASLNTGNVDFNASDLAGSRGTVNMNSTGTMTLGTTYVGKNGNSVGVFNQTNGTVTNAGTGNWRIGGVSTATSANPDVNSYGIYNMSGGSLTLANDFQIGAGGSGVFNQSAGAVSTGGWLTPARFGSASNGLINISGGSFAQSAATNTTMIIGEQGRAVVNLTGGALTAASNVGLRLSNQAGAIGILNVLGGVASAQSMVDLGGTSYLYLNGGTVRALSSSGTFINGLDNAVVGPNGVTFDSNGLTPTIPQVLASPAGSGITSIAVGTGGAGYVGEPIVNITGGGGTGATARAIITGGVITGYTITNPGINYTSAPTVTLSGGGATAVATPGVAATGLNVTTGGLTTIGTGTLTLTGANTYLGATTISAGTLGIATITDGGTAGPLGASTNAASNLVFDGGTLNFTGGTAFTDRNFTINAGKTATINVTTAPGDLTINGGSAATNGALSKTGPGTLRLGGVNSHTGTTTVDAGVLAAGGTFGSGFVVNSGGHLAPGSFGVSTLNVPTLTLAAGSAVDFEFGAGVNDIANITNAGGLSLSTTALYLYEESTTNPFNPVGPTSTYTLFDYTGTFAGSLTGAFSIANSQIGKIYSISNNTINTRIELTINDAVLTEWTNAAGGSWNTALNWTNGVPNSIGAVATFGNALGASSSITVDGAKTLGTMIFDNFGASYTLTGGAGDTITLNNGLGAPSISVNSGSHTVAAPLVLAQTTNLNPGFGTTLTISGNISGAGTGLAVAGGGTVVLSGTNSYTGATTINAGTLEIAGGASLGSSSGLIEKNGGIFRVNSGGATTITQPISLDIAGGTPTAVSGAADGVGNFAIEVATGTTATFTGAITNPSGSLVIRGGGTLRFTNPGASVFSNLAGLGTVVQNGAVVLDGGPGATYGVVGGELTIGDQTPNQVSLTLNSGTLNAGTFVSVGRGNGTTALASSLNVTGGTINAVNLFSGFDAGVGGYNGAPVMNLSGGNVNVTTTRLGESQGSNSSLNLSGNAALTNAGDFQIGWGGNAIVTIADSATLTIARLAVGYGNNAGGNIGAGVIRQTAGIVTHAGASTLDSRIGGATGVNDALTYGSYAISGGSFTSNRNLQIGSFGVGVMDISGTGSVTTTGGFPVVGRFANSFGLLNISGGSFNESTAGNQLIIGEAGNGTVDVSGTGSLIVAGAPGVAGNNPAGGTGGIRLGHTATGVGALNINGGTVTTSGIARSDAAGVGRVYLNGGVVQANASNTTFMQGLTAAVIGPDGATFDTNGNDIAIAQTLDAASGQGVASIAVVDGGSGYLGRPIVEILGDGTGASAIANVNAAGVVTGITITNPGTGYTFPPTINLRGNGTAVPATFDITVLAANATNGAVTKIGAGKLTLTGAQNYSTLNAVAGTTQVDAPVGSGTSTVNVATVAASTATAQITVSQTLAALNIGAGGTVIFGAAAPDPEEAAAAAPVQFEDASGLADVSVQAVPEPASASLLLLGALGLLGRRRSRR